MKALLVLLTLAITVVAEEPKPRVAKVFVSRGIKVMLDPNDAPDLENWGKKAVALCFEWHTKITFILSSEGYIAPRGIVLYFDPKMQGVAQTAGGKITISAPYVRAHLDDYGMVIHELTHVLQAYPPGGPGWLVEGIADYIRIVKFEPEAPRPKLDPAKASYKDAYKTTAMFLEWVEKHHAADLVVKMNAALRAGKYRDELWKEIAGKTVDELWKLFVETLPAKS